MKEAAQHLRISRRALQELVKRHPHYYFNGCRKLFEESDIIKLREAMRCAVKERGAKQPFFSSRLHHSSGESNKLREDQCGQKRSGGWQY